MHRRKKRERKSKLLIRLLFSPFFITFYFFLIDVARLRVDIEKSSYFLEFFKENEKRTRFSTAEIKNFKLYADNDSKKVIIT